MPHHEIHAMVGSIVCAFALTIGAAVCQAQSPSEPAAGATGSVDALPHARSTIVASADDDLQSLIDNADPYTRIVAGGREQRLSQTIFIAKDGIVLEGFNLMLESRKAPAMLTIHNCKDVVVRDCTLAYPRDGEGPASRTNGITITAAQRVRIEHCRVTGFNLQGITATTNPLHGPLRGKGGPIADILIAHNHLSDIGNGDILLSGGRGHEAVRGWIIGNVCTSTRQDVLNVIDGFQHARVRDNYVEGAGVGLAIEQHDRGVDRPVKDVLVEGNVFRQTPGNAPAISFDHAAGKFEDIRIVRNTLIGNPRGKRQLGIRVGEYDVSGLTIADNTFESWTGAAIDLNQTRGERGISIRDNLIRDGGAGIHLFATSASVNGNRLMDLDHNAIDIDLGHADLKALRVAGNHITGSAGSIVIRAARGYGLRASIVKDNMTDVAIDTRGVVTQDSVISDNLILREPNGVSESGEGEPTGGDGDGGR